MKQKCLQCNSSGFWLLGDGRIKCKDCYRRFSIKKKRDLIDRKLLRSIAEEFLLEHSTNIILERVNVSKYKLLKILTLLRIVMTKDIPPVFSGIVEVDETFLGPKMRNRRQEKRRKLGKNRSGFGTVKQPVFGILCRGGKVWAEVVEKVEAKNLQPLIKKQVKAGSTVCSDSWRAYTGLASKGYVHRIVKHGQGQYSDKKGNHINGLEGFWGYLKRKLQSKGGIRREKLPLYLGEYVWRFNHRKLPLKEQKNSLVKQFYQHIRSG